MYNFTVGKPPHNPKLLVRVSGFDHDKGNTLSSRPSTLLGNRTTYFDKLSTGQEFHSFGDCEISTHSARTTTDACFFSC